jgi:peptide/nickel transport system ATP-binding protein
VLSIRGLHLAFVSRDARGAPRRARVLNGVDLDVGPGRIVGLIGETGAGKSMTATATIGLLPPSAELSGQIVFEGTDLLGLRGTALDKVRGARIGFVAQNPRAALEPVTRVGDQLVRLIRAHSSLSGPAARERAIEVLTAVGIPDPQARYRSYPHELSGGMNQRVMIAMALAGEPDLLIADEPTTALDATIQAQILDLLSEVRRDQGMAMVLISHDLSVIAQECSRVMVMYAGRAAEIAATDNLFRTAKHPYTQGLLSCVPDVASPQKRLTAIPGQVPEAGRLPKGCSFEPRCAQSMAQCSGHVPMLSLVEPDHQVACFLATP